jgi:hypothetical protein
MDALLCTFFQSLKSLYLSNRRRSNLPNKEFLFADQTSPSTFIYADRQWIIN